MLNSEYYWYISPVKFANSEGLVLVFEELVLGEDSALMAVSISSSGSSDVYLSIRLDILSLSRAIFVFTAAGSSVVVGKN